MALRHTIGRFQAMRSAWGLTACTFVRARTRCAKGGEKNTQHETRQLNPWRTRTRQDATPAFCGKQTHLCNKAVESVVGRCGYKTTPPLLPTRVPPGRLDPAPPVRRWRFMTAAVTAVLAVVRITRDRPRAGL